MCSFVFILLGEKIVGGLRACVVRLCFWHGRQAGRQAGREAGRQARLAQAGYHFLDRLYARLADSLKVVVAKSCSAIGYRYDIAFGKLLTDFCFLFPNSRAPLRAECIWMTIWRIKTGFTILIIYNHVERQMFGIAFCWISIHEL